MSTTACCVTPCVCRGARLICKLDYIPPFEEINREVELICWFRAHHMQHATWLEDIMLWDIWNIVLAFSIGYYVQNQSLLVSVPISCILSGVYHIEHGVRYSFDVPNEPPHRHVSTFYGFVDGSQLQLNIFPTTMQVSGHFPLPISDRQCSYVLLRLPPYSQRWTCILRLQTSTVYQTENVFGVWHHRLGVIFLDEPSCRAYCLENKVTEYIQADGTAFLRLCKM